jgi:hypothetical protein
MTMDDVPPATPRTLNNDVIYPNGVRYTLHWLSKSSPVTESQIPNNSDATFRRRNLQPRPADLLLHYNYGAAALVQWGVGVEALGEKARPHIQHPVKPITADMGPKRIVNDRTIAVAKRRPMDEGQAGSSAADAEMIEDEDTPVGPDDVVLFLWGNTRAATERRQNAADDRARRMEAWNSGGLYV